MFRATWSATATWMITALGAMSLSTDMFGIQPRSPLAGLHTATATGTGSAPGAGLGLTMRLGALRPSIMAAGHSLAAHGAGARVPSLVRLCLAQRLSAFSAEALVSAPDLAGAVGSAGSRWALVSRSSPGSLAGGVSSL